MRNMILAIILMTSMPSVASAQMNPFETADMVLRQRGHGGSIYRGNVYSNRGGYYGYYDPATIQQMLNLPEALIACQMDFSTGKVVSCHPVIKTATAINAYSQNPDGILGTMHVEKGNIHFRPFDDTNPRIGTGTGGALGAGAGAVIGGTIGGRKVAAIGAVGGGLLTGWLASRHNHDNCLSIEPAVSQTSGLLVETTFVESASVTTSMPAEIPNERKLVRNRFEDANIRIYDGSKRILELTAGSDDEVKITSSSRIWGEAYLENPLNGKMEWVPLQLGRGINNLPEDAGWVFGNPNTQPSL